MNPKHENRAWCTVQNLHMNYIHIETPEAENCKHLKSQETDRMCFTHTYMHVGTHSHMHVHTCSHTAHQSVS